MEQLQKLKLLLGSPQESDLVLEFYLESAKNIICDIRNTNEVESKYLQTQLRIAIELYNKRGIEGQVAHGENGINRSYDAGEISKALLNTITPVAKTPYTQVKVIQ